MFALKGKGSKGSKGSSAKLQHALSGESTQIAVSCGQVGLTLVETKLRDICSGLDELGIVAHVVLRVMKLP